MASRIMATVPFPVSSKTLRGIIFTLSNVKFAIIPETCEPCLKSSSKSSCAPPVKFLPYSLAIRFSKRKC